jgi:hypothetical protein
VFANSYILVHTLQTGLGIDFIHKIREIQSHVQNEHDTLLNFLTKTREMKKAKPDTENSAEEKYRKLFYKITATS